MAALNNLLSTENPVFSTLMFHTGVLVIKMMAMSVLTARQRIKNKAFANPEDAANMKVKPKTDDNVERVRRAHLNDLENILIFIPAAFGFMMTNPDAGLAINLIRAFSAARIAHTLVYAVVVVPQPARALSWGVGYFITGYMAFKTMMHFA